MTKISNVKTGVQGAPNDESPSKALLAPAETTVPDAAGRVIKLRRPGILAQYRLIEALGDSAASNDTYVRMVMPILYVVQIDDDAVPPLRTKAEVEALIQRLDDHGMRAVMEGIGELAAKAAEGDPAAIKKSS
ncbi:hypothetical protein FEE59_13845 [Herbaspirillum sp. RU 5E]|nr:hypothetical protein [Herbaspirillum sp. RU 5E]